MPNGLRLSLPLDFTDTTLPVLRDDSVLVPGSLALFDLAHSANPTSGYINATSGVPVNGAKLNNLAWKEAAALLGGSPSQASLAGNFYTAGLTGTKGKLERTTKGAVHSIFSQTVADSAGTAGTKVELPTALLNYLYANYDHSIFFSLWFNVTRDDASGISGGPVWSLFGKLAGGATSSYKEKFAQLSQVANASPESIAPGGGTVGFRASAIPGVSALTPPAAGMRISNFAGNSHAGSVPTSNTDIGGPLFVVGNGSVGANGVTAAGSVTRDKSGSAALYRVYVEDLTASGRSYAQADAADFAAYTRDVLTAGGRYNNDVIPTSPSTIP